MPKMEKRKQTGSAPCRASKKKHHRKQTQEKRQRKPTLCTLCSYLFEYANHSQIVKFTRGVGQHGARAVQERSSGRTRRVYTCLNLLPYNGRTGAGY